MQTRLVPLLLRVALAISVLSTIALGWNLFAMGRFLEFHGKAVPLGAEAVSRRVAPLLTSSDAQKVYAYVQVQHAELAKQHELTQELAEGAYASTLLALVASSLLAVCLAASLWLLYARPNSNRAH